MENVQSIFEQILAENKKSKIGSYITAVCMCLMVLIIGISALILVPKASKILDRTNVTFENAQEALDRLKTATKDMTEFYENNAQGLTDTVESIRSIDYEALNKAIRDLQSSIEPFADFMSLFKK